MIHPRIAARAFNTPLMVHAGKAAAIMAGLGGRMAGREINLQGAEILNHIAFDPARVSLGTLGDTMGQSQTNQRLYDALQGTAIIRVEGTLVHKGGWVDSNSGETSYQGLQAQIAQVRRDASIKGVAFEFDTCGGEVSGAFETADMLFQLSQEKPTIAILSDCAYSAGYLLASACRQIVAPPQGGVGSIGVITMHTDMSGALAATGLNVTILKAGLHKADANPFEPLPADVATSIMEELDELRVAFATAVGTYRGTRFSFDQAMATEAATYDGLEAVEMGLADATAFPSDAFQAFLSALNT